MKNHIAFKFIALLLCAAALLGALTSGLGILGLTVLELYDKSVDEYYQDSRSRQALRYASDLVSRYASRELGGVPENVTQDYFYLYGMEQTIRDGNLEYELIDPQTGEILESSYASTDNGMPWLEIPGDGGYLKLVEDTPVQTETIPVTTLPEPEPQEETLPPETEVTLPPSEEAVSETTSQPGEFADLPEEPTELVEFPGEVFPAPEEESSFLYSAWDSELQQHRDFRLSYQQAPEYQVRLRLHLVGDTDENLWELLRLVWNVRYDLYKVLGVCLLIFAVCIVYLCCAAGRRPGTDEVRAGGLNRLPLDAWFLCLALAVALTIGYGPRLLVDLAEFSMEGAVALYAGCGYLGCLLIVHFLFGFAAQAKTPGGCWYRNSACGLCLRLTVWGWNWSIDILEKLFRMAVRLCKWLWSKLWPLTVRLLRAGRKFTLFLWLQLAALWAWFRRLTARAAGWLWRSAVRFLGMMPLTWQWMAAGFLMIFFLLLSLNSTYGWVQVLGIGLCVAMVLYGAGAFGTLLQSAKRMRQGDLDTKVQDTLLIGSFREFAGELNGLADVAVVAAQKQLKSERMKTELITNVSHDIKTPLTSIINYVDLMKRPHSEQEQEQYMEVLDRQSQRLKKLIDDLMEMSKASTGNITLEIGVVDAAEAVNQALGEFADKLGAVPLHPVFRQPEERISMLADGKLVWRVLSNVLGNACKYALPGTRLYVDLQKLEGRVIISLKNISREELNVEADELMERFVRGDASRNAEGSGLGLNIAKSLMELQRGELQLLVDGDLFKVTLVFPGV